MKSLEYFHWGLPVINNIPSDTFDIVSENGCGFNLDEEQIDSTVHKIGTLSQIEYQKMSQKSREVYLKYFDEVVVRKQFNELFDSLDI